MKSIIIILCVLLLQSCAAEDSNKISIVEIKDSTYNYIYAYSVKDSVFIYNTLDSTETFISVAYDPNISPDGKKIVYTEYQKKADASPSRKLVLYDINSKSKVFIPTPTENCFAAKWSPDGSKIVFSMNTFDKWDICVIDSNLNNLKNLTTNFLDNSFSPTWNQNSNTVFFHNLDTLFAYNIYNNELKFFKLENMKISSVSSFVEYKDKNIFLYDAEIDETTLAYPSNSIFEINFNNNQVKRLTSEDMICYDLQLSNDNSILFATTDIYSRPFSVFEYKNNSYKKVLKRGSKPSRAIIN